MLQTYWIASLVVAISPDFLHLLMPVGSSLYDSSFADGIFELVASPSMTASSASLPFTSEQCQQLLSLLHTPSVPSEGSAPSAAHMVHSHDVLGGIYSLPSHFSSPNRIIDTDASNHMINSINLFSSNIRICQSSISLPDGQSVLVSHIGIVQLSPSLILENVLCVTSFHFNLISVSKLTTDLHCCLSFFHDHYLIQHRTD